MRQTPPSSSWRGNRWFFLVGCSCLWGIFVLFTARDFLATKDVDDYSLKSFKSTRNSHEDCPHGNITAAQTLHSPTNKDEIRALFDRWNEALLTGNPRAVADLYFDNQRNGSGNADKTKTKDEKMVLLLPTLSNETRTNLDSVEDYFVSFLKRKPRGRIVSGQILVGPDGSWAHDAGIYEFVLQNVPPDKLDENEASNSKKSLAAEEMSPNTSVVRARYSFFYLRDEKGEWKIAHHHSSLMPE